MMADSRGGISWKKRGRSQDQTHYEYEDDNGREREGERKREEEEGKCICWWGGTLTDDVWWGRPQLVGGRAKEREAWYGVHTSTETTHIQGVSAP